MSDSIPPPRASGNFRVQSSDEDTVPRKETTIELLAKNLGEVQVTVGQMDARSKQTLDLVLAIKAADERNSERFRQHGRRIRRLELQREYMPLLLSVLSFAVIMLHVLMGHR